MKVLIATSFNKKKISAFISDQVNEINKNTIKTEYFLIDKKGVIGYFINYIKLFRKIKSFQPNLIHAHYGLTGLLCSLQRRIPVIITFHGSDINIMWIRLFSKLAFLLANESIFVSTQLAKTLNINNPIIIPCGVNLGTFKQSDNFQNQSNKMNNNNKTIIFSSAFVNKVKNYSLAKKSIEILNRNIFLKELKNYSRKEVNVLLNSSKIALLTSFSEGSPQFIKEAMACNIPIVSTNVGDVAWLIDGVDGCYLTSFEPEDVADKIRKALEFSEKIGRTKGRERIIQLGLDSETIAKEIIEVYKKVLSKK